MYSYYTTGEFAKKAKVTIRTIRYYDKLGLLKPTKVNEAGYRLYTDKDFGKLLKIMSLKSLGFSLQEIGLIDLQEDAADLKSALQTQHLLLKRKLEQFEAMEEALRHTIDLFDQDNKLDWNEILNLIHLCSTERTLVEQYKDATNLDIRILLHEKFSINKIGWFGWIFNQLNLMSSKNGLELGCGNAKLWSYLDKSKSYDIKLYLTDQSQGMVQDASRNIKKIVEKIEIPPAFEYNQVDCQSIPYGDQQFDSIIANHVLFYVENIHMALDEIHRVMMHEGTFYCSTYGKSHMIEITQLVQEFDSRISLSDTPLYERFGLHNGKEILSEVFSTVELNMYEDALLVDEVEPLMLYILSCHGNQNDFLYQRQEEFKAFLQHKLDQEGVIRITKEAGLFICKK